ncbi:peptidoglycan endopeptidase [Flavobacterium ammoniigenes]|jgi:cell wall-associated NlpC family hydrolase|uniref:Peptidoglycan endopeptidase n=1 Tax=Flavobacterium ammoniigenes TaxID=1751095 RepID=A0ABN6KZB7_9FLAO|nr:peptidoglycan endopeptidase [Flavobacterium ammoniigenes]BDB53712.1 peptidoglycan endopeptidase [Flavobacterium ammoniigenes]
MKFYKLLFIIAFINFSNVFSQEKLIKHTVKKGETISAIAQKYQVEPSAIYELNPDCSRVLKLESIILIPRSTSKGSKVKTESKITSIEKTHEVQPKETLFGIAKQYEISLEELNTANPELVETGLKAGQKIKIPTKDNQNNAALIKKDTPKLEPKKEVVLKDKNGKSVAESVVLTTTTLTHEVLPSETKFGIAKQYGISVADLDKVNPILENEALKAGQKILIPVKEGTVVSQPIVKQAEVVSPIKIEVKENAKEPIVVINKEKVEENAAIVTHEVLAKETKYGIAKKYGISVADLEAQNPNIIKNLYVGAKLNISGAKAIQEAVVVAVNNDNSDTEEIKDNLTIASSLAKWNTNEELADELIRMASDNLGIGYRSGGTNKNGFDCSGLMYATFSSLDIKLPRSSQEMATIGTVIDVNQAQKGDLIFFKTRGGNQINHVGMVVEVNEGEIRFIHSATHGGVIISSTKEKYYEKNFTQINRVLQQ